MWTSEWHNVVLSEESHFCLSNGSHRVRVWRRRRDRPNPTVTIERHTARQYGIMVCSTIAYDSRSLLERKFNNMTVRRYVDDVLQSTTLPFIQWVLNAIYQQDNVRPDREHIHQHALQMTEVLPWLHVSPDFSLIEHV